MNWKCMSTVDIYHFLCHDSQEVDEGDLPRAILVHFTDHLLYLLFLRFKPQSSHCNLTQRLRWTQTHTHTFCYLVDTHWLRSVFEPFFTFLFFFYLKLFDINVS